MFTVTCGKLAERYLDKGAEAYSIGAEAHREGARTAALAYWYQARFYGWLYSLLRRK